MTKLNSVEEEMSYFDKVRGFIFNEDHGYETPDKKVKFIDALMKFHTEMGKIVSDDIGEIQQQLKDEYTSSDGKTQAIDVEEFFDDALTEEIRLAQEIVHENMMYKIDQLLDLRNLITNKNV